MNGPPPKYWPVVPPVPSLSSRVLSQFDGCRITVSGWTKLDPAVLAITFASATELSSAAKRV